MTRPLSITPEIAAQRAGAVERMIASANAFQAKALSVLDDSPQPVLRTGSLDLDMATGVGGWPEGRVVMLYGPYSSGKTTVALHAAVEAQKAGKTVVFVDAENALSKKYMATLGVDISSMAHHQPESLQTAIDLMDHLLDVDIADTQSKGLLIIVDSVPALAASEVMEKSAEDQTRAATARLWSSQLPKLTLKAARSGAIIMLLNQERSGMPQKPWEPAKVIPGGEAIKFASSIMVSVARKVDKGDPKDRGPALNQEIRLTLVKNKVAPPFTQAIMEVVPGQAVDWVQDVMAVGAFFETSGVLANTQWELDKKTKTHSLVAKNGWFTYVLAPGELEVARAEEKAWHDAQVRAVRAEHAAAQKEEKAACAEVGADFDARPFVAPELKSALKVKDKDEDVEAISVYREKNFLDQMRVFPSLVEAAENRVLALLRDDPSKVAKEMYAAEAENAAADLEPAASAPTGGAGRTSLVGTRKGAGARA